MAPTLYYTDTSPLARAVVLTGKALGIDFNLKYINLAAGEQLTPEFLKMNPQHTVPTLVDEDGFVVYDSHAITRYLVDKYGKNSSLYPKDLKKRAVVDQRLHFDDSPLYIRSRLSVVALIRGAKEVPQEHADALKDAYGFLEAFINGNNYVAGNELTIADLHIAATLTTAETLLPVSPSEFPKTTAWLNRIKALPYFKDANEKGVKMFSDFVNSKRA